MTGTLDRVEQGPADGPGQVVAAVGMLPCLPGAADGGRYNPRGLTALWLLDAPETTRRTYFPALASWLAHCERADLDPLQARRADVDAWKTTMTVDKRGHDGTITQDSPSASTVNTRLAAVTSWYEYLISNDAADRNPASKVKRLRTSNRSPYPTLTPDESVQLMSHLDQRAESSGRETALRDAALIRLMVGTALRTSAALGAVFEHISFESGHTILWYVQKGGHLDYVPLAPHVLDGLYRYLDVRAAREGVAREQLRGPIFVSTPQPPRHAGGNALKQRDLQRILRRAARQAGLEADERITPHSLRATAATVALANGASLAEVQDLLGHASPTTTRRYDAARHRLDTSPVHTLAATYAKHRSTQ